MTHPIVNVLNAQPINKQAALLVAQAGCEDERGYLTRTELTALLQRLHRKMRLLKRVLSIQSKAQHKGLRLKHNKRLPQYRQQKEPRAFSEYLRCGEEINRLNCELALDRKCRQLAAQQEQTWKSN